MRTKHLIAFSILVAFLALPFGAQAQATKPDLLKQQILDAESVQQSATKFPFLSQERAALNQLLDQLVVVAGFQRNYLPIEMKPLEGDVLAKVGGICEDLVKWTAAAREKMKANQALVGPEQFEESHTVLCLHPGAYYLGLNSDPLCENVFRGEMYMLQLQDYPFEEAASGDECLWDMAKHAPNLGRVVAFACDISNEVLKEMHLERLTKLAVLELSENSLTTIYPELFAAGTIRSLDLGKNRITRLPDNLAPMKGLVYLNLRGNPVDAIERERILKGLPNTKVLFE